MFSRITFGLQKSTTKIMYLSYCALGGIVKSEYVPRSMKYIWIAYNIISFTLVHSCINYYLIFQEKVEILPVLHSGLIVIASSTTFFAYFVTFYFNSNLIKLMKFLDQEDDVFDVDKKDERCYDAKKIIRYHSLSMFLATTYFSLRWLRVLLIGGTAQTFSSYYSYFYCFRQMNDAKSWKIYNIYYGIQVITIAPLFFPLIMLSVFVTTVTFELFNKFIKVTNNVKAYSELYMMKADILFEERMNSKSNFENNFMAKRLHTINQEFNANIIKSIKIHQELVGSTAYYKTYVEIFFSLFLPFVLVIMTTEGFFLVAHLQLTTLSDFTVLILEVAVAILKLCDMGRLLEDMNEILKEQVYDTPWYRLPKKQRQLLYIYLCQTQKTINFFAIKIFPMHLPTFPRMLRLAFSIVQVTSRLRQHL